MRIHTTNPQASDASRPGGTRSVLALALLVVPAAAAVSRQGETDGVRTVHAKVQPRPGGPLQELDMRVHPVPVDPPTVGPDQARLEDDELVLGLVVEGRAMAFPIRYLALSEVVNARVGEIPVAPTW